MRLKYQIIGCGLKGLAYFSRGRGWYMRPKIPEDFTFDTLEEAKHEFAEAVNVQNYFGVTNVHIIALMEDD